MKNIFLILFVPFIFSCSEKENINIERDFTVDSKVVIYLSDTNGVDLLNPKNNTSISVEDITLNVSGNNDNNKGRAPYYPYFTMKDYLSPVYTKYLSWNETLKRNSLEIVLSHSYTNTTTVLEWNNDFPSDILRGEMKLDKKDMVVKCVKLYLNETLVWTESSNKDRSVEIKKSIMGKK